MSRRARHRAAVPLFFWVLVGDTEHVWTLTRRGVQHSTNPA